MLAAALILALASSTRQIPVSLQEQPKETTITPPPKPAAPVTAQPTAQRRYRNVPFIERIEELDTPGAASWEIPGLLGGLGLLASLGYVLWLRRARRPPSDPAPSFDPELDQHFDAGTVGGAPEPWFDRQTLDHLADSVTFFQSEAAGRRLDARTTIARTANAGGCPSLAFERRRRVRRVIVLEDGFAEAEAWNPLAGELARGLERRGIPVLHGRFWGSPDASSATSAARSCSMISATSAAPVSCSSSATASRSGGQARAMSWNGSRAGRGSRGWTSASRGAGTRARPCRPASGYLCGRRAARGSSRRWPGSRTSGVE